MNALASTPETRSLSRRVRLVARDGFELGASVYEPLSPARGAVVLSGATAVPASYYGRFAEHLAASGLWVLTYDYRGIGDSKPGALRGFSANMTDWAMLDAAAALDLARREHGDDVVLVGHSFGGQVLGLLDDARAVRGAVLVGAQLGYFGHWPLAQRLRLALVWKAVVPAATSAFGYLPGRLGLGEDLPAGVAEEWAEWCSNPEYLMGLHPAARPRFARFDRPTLFYSFTDDDYAPEAAVDHLVRALAKAPLSHRRFHPRELGVDDVGHFGFFRPRFERSLWRETRFFVDDVLSGRTVFRLPPSKAPWGLTEDDLSLDLAFGRQ